MKMKFLIPTPQQDTKHTYHVDQWYDRYSRSWVTQVLDERGCQQGAAAYSGTRADAVFDMKQASARAAELNTGAAE